MELPKEVLEGVANIIRQICTQENGYTFISHQTIGPLNYKIVVKLDDVDPTKEAKKITIVLTREDEE
jgi:hypothetical protein